MHAAEQKILFWRKEINDMKHVNPVILFPDIILKHVIV